MNIVKIEEKQISGISVRTKNADEMNPETAKIGHLYQKFDEDVSVNYKDGARVYGVYFNYESDTTGEFTVLAGSDRAESDKLSLEQVKIPAGKYMVFTAQGDMPQVVIDTWEKYGTSFRGKIRPMKERSPLTSNTTKVQTKLRFILQLSSHIQVIAALQCRGSPIWG